MNNLLTPALSVTVQIAEGDIEHGHIAQCRSCPAALAANRATGLFCDVGGLHLVAYDNRQYLDNGNLLVRLLPEEAGVWITRFDSQRNGIVNAPPRPFSFPLELYRIADFTKRTHDPEVREMLAEAPRSTCPWHRSSKSTPTRPSWSSPDPTAISSGASDAGSTGPARPSPTSTGRRHGPGPTTYRIAPAISGGFRPNTGPRKPRGRRVNVPFGNPSISGLEN